ncbi:MAG: hypothetical protein R3B09_27420 [Nannocystaceae bacterium]
MTPDLRRAHAHARLALALGLLAACDAPTRPLPSPDPRRFVDEAYPVLLRDCAFGGCHGDPRRPLFVPGPGRTRLDPTNTEPFDPPTAAELALAHDRVRGLLAQEIGGGGEDALPLLLEKTQAGAGHRGRDAHGRNVYEDPEASGYHALVAWLEGGE